jgi:hypothetical protein
MLYFYLIIPIVIFLLLAIKILWATQRVKNEQQNKQQ